MDSAIFTPFMAMILLTFIVWVHLYAVRIPLLLSAKAPNDELTAAQLAEISPPEVANPSNNLKNLFELRVLFYALRSYL